MTCVCSGFDLSKVNDMHKKCEYCVHQACATVKEIGNCPCICHFGLTYCTFGNPKIDRWGREEEDKTK